MVVTKKDNEMLCSPVTRNEIWEVIKNMPAEKAPGPVGFPVEFFQKF